MNDASIFKESRAAWSRSNHKKNVVITTITVAVTVTLPGQRPPATELKKKQKNEK